MRTVQCKNCKKDFISNHSGAKWCPEKCRQNSMRRSWNKYSQKNRLKRNAYHRELYEREKEKHIARINAYQKTPAGKKAVRIAYLNQKLKWGYKIIARQKVLIATRSGRLKKQSCWCGEQKVQAHHPDYTKPLDVIWVCMYHHQLIHKNLKNARRFIYDRPKVFTSTSSADSDEKSSRKS